jgi:hypothetical protein
LLIVCVVPSAQVTRQAWLLTPWQFTVQLPLHSTSHELTALQSTTLFGPTSTPQRSAPEQR